MMPGRTSIGYTLGPLPKPMVPTIEAVTGLQANYATAPK